LGSKKTNMERTRNWYRKGGVSAWGVPKTLGMKCELEGYGPLSPGGEKRKNSFITKHVLKGTPWVRKERKICVLSGKKKTKMFSRKVNRVKTGGANYDG